MEVVYSISYGSLVLSAVVGVHFYKKMYFFFMLGVSMTAQLSSLKRDVFLKVFFIFDDFLPFKLWLKKKKKNSIKL